MSNDAQLQGVLEAYYALTPDQQSIFSQLSASPSPSTTPQSLSPLVMNTPALYASPQPVLYQSMPQVSRAMPVSGRRVARPRPRPVRDPYHKKRPLNAFMAFRSLYSTQLPGLTQKVKSGLLRQMWAAEPRKRLFTILAEAYTDIRDNHLEPVQLDKFLAVTASHIPVIPADEYLLKMGWILTIAGTDQATITRSSTFDVDAVNFEYPERTDTSSVDLVNHCYESGTIQRSSRLAPRLRGRANVMAMPIAPAAPPAPAAPVQSSPTAFDDFSFEYSLQALTAPAQPMPDFNFNDPISDLRDEYQPSIEAVTADQQQAYERTPFALHFHPDIQPPDRCCWFS